MERSKSEAVSWLRILLVLTALLIAGPLANGSALAQRPSCGPGNIFSDPGKLGGVMCSQFYGLCIGAPCESTGQFTPTGFEQGGFVIGGGLADLSDVAETVLCKCPLINGNSIGNGSCEDRAPDGTKSISTYSFQFNNSQNRFLECDQDDFSEKLRFADCYNQPCELDPLDPNMVICKCPAFLAEAIPDETYLTRGGDCRKSACAETIWSAVPPELLPFVDASMACGIGIPEPPPRFSCGTRRFFTPVH